jgi:hypothetical protein
VRGFLLIKENKMEDKILKISWPLFVSLAKQKLTEKYPIDDGVAPKFMRSNSYEPDSEVYDIPAYVEIKLT